MKVKWPSWSMCVIVFLLVMFVGVLVRVKRGERDVQMDGWMFK